MARPLTGLFPLEAELPKAISEYHIWSARESIFQHILEIPFKQSGLLGFISRKPIPATMIVFAELAGAPIRRIKSPNSRNEAASALMTRTRRWSRLRAWGVSVAKRRGMKRAASYTARSRFMALPCCFDGSDRVLTADGCADRRCRKVQVGTCQIEGSDGRNEYRKSNA
jgi:hypothetical protein